MEGNHQHTWGNSLIAPGGASSGSAVSASANAASCGSRHMPEHRPARTEALGWDQPGMKLSHSPSYSHLATREVATTLSGFGRSGTDDPRAGDRQKRV